MKKILWIILSSFLLGALILGGLLYYLMGPWWEITIDPLPQEASTQIAIEVKKEQGSKNDTGLSLKVPAGFSISYFTKNIGGARDLIEDPQGTLIVSLPLNGKVVALPDTDNDGKTDKTIPILEKLKNPHGLAFRCREICQLYSAETDQITRFEYDPETFLTSNKTVLVKLPKGGLHSTRSLLYIPEEDQILVSIGSSCDVCHESNDQYAKVFSMNPDGSDFKEYARGLRNSVFMTLHPQTNQVWATEMGRDRLGDDLPPDEINILQKEKNYGWPNCFGKNIHDNAFDKNTYIRNPCMEPFEQPSYIDLPAHSAPLGLAFFPASWPQEYRNDLLVAYHGSWNSSTPKGYKIVRFQGTASGGLEPEEEDFISGWINGIEVSDRPVDILITSEKKIYISDDKSGNIYLIKLLERN